MGLRCRKRVQNGFCTARCVNAGETVIREVKVMFFWLLVGSLSRQEFQFESSSAARAIHQPDHRLRVPASAVHG
jgi:hypothetical protein